ncbi:hypothetical protein BH24DEI2_BH24DEI2_14910 [soil metagenome]
MSTNQLEVRLFGSPVFEWAGQRLGVPTRKGAALLSCVALRGATPRAELAELLWGVGFQRNLRLELHRLRQLPGAATWLTTNPFVSVEARTDVGGFESALAAGDFGRALALYEGQPDMLLLHGLEPKNAPAFQDWLDVERQRVAALLRDALRGHVERLEAAGKPAEALVRAWRLIGLDALDESAHRTVMRLCWSLSDVTAAQRQFETCRRVLREELGVAPLPETQELAAAIENALSADLTTPGPRRLPPTLLRPPVLVGREAEWAALERAWARAQAVYISGPPGVGKTRLLLDFVQHKTNANFSLVQGRVGDVSVPLSTLARAWRNYFERFSDAPEQLEPWVQREVARFLPERFTYSTPPLQTEQDLLRFRSAVHALFAEKCQRVDANVADDLQFFDSTSFFLSAYATGRLVREGLPDKPVHTLTAFRSDEMPPPFFEAIARQVSAGRAVHLELAPLTVQATRALLQTVELPADEAAGRDLRRVTGGNPLYIVEMLRDQFEKGRPFSAGDALPERVEVRVRERLARLSNKALYLARTLAILQDFATHDVLEAALGVGALELSESLAELERAQLIEGLVFSHDLLYEAVVQNTPKAVAQLVHHKVAAALETRVAPPARVAYHWEKALQPERARPWHLRAAAIAVNIAVTQASFDQARGWLERVLVSADTESELYRQAKTLLDTVQTETRPS